MAEKRDTNSIPTRQLLEMTGLVKSIIQPQNVAPTNLETPEDQKEMRSISPRQEGFNPHLATNTYSSLYFSTSMVLSDILDCLPSDNSVLLAPCVQDEVLWVMHIHMIMPTNYLFLQVI